MSRALIGYSGFVGGTLLRQAGFDDLYRSANISEIVGKRYEFVVCAGAPAAKWKANRDPEGDLANIGRLMQCLQGVEADVFVLISSVDVYPRPAGVYEDDVISPEAAEPYGRHRYRLERFVADRFRHAFRVRLPGLFGEGIRKNFIFDLLQNPVALPRTHRDSVFQFYDMSRLWDDVQRVVHDGPPVVNFATEPVRAGEVARQCFDIAFDNITEGPPVHYDMRTRYAAIFGAAGPYMSRANDVLDQITRFARAQKRELAAG